MAKQESPHTQQPAFTTSIIEFANEPEFPDLDQSMASGKRGFNLVPDKSLNLKMLKGEQDHSNLISYAE